MKADPRTDPRPSSVTPITPHARGPNDVSLLRYCQLERPSIPERVQLVERIAAEIQRAHDRSVVPTGLEPGHVHVDGPRERPRLTILGLGEATERVDRRVPPRLRPLGPLGTEVEFLAPERTGHCDLPIDSRADVWSLGALLYWLLVDRPPFDAATLEAAVTMGHLEWIYRDGPLPASAHVGTAADGGHALAAERRTTPGELRAALRDGLDGTLRRALALDPRERHGSAAELERELRWQRERRWPASVATTSHRRLAGVWTAVTAGPRAWIAGRRSPRTHVQEH